MSLQTRLSALITAIGADIKNLNMQATAVLSSSTVPADGGYLLFNNVLESMASTSSITAGQLYLLKFTNRKNTSITVSSATVLLGAAGASLTNVGFALYSSAGALLTSSVNTNGATATAFQTANPRTVTFSTPQTIAAGASFYVGFWMTGTTMPTLYRSTGTNYVSNFGTSSGGYKFATTTDTGLTTAAPPTFGTQSQLGAAFFCAVG